MKLTKILQCHSSHNYCISVEQLEEVKKKSNSFKHKKNYSLSF